MADDGASRWDRVQNWIIAAYVIVTGPVVLWSLGSFFDAVLPGLHSSLVIVSDTRVRNVAVTFDGRRVQPHPEPIPGGSGIGTFYHLFPDLRGQGPSPTLAVSWTTADGPRSVSRPLEVNNNFGNCLYVLRLDRAGEPMPPVDLGGNAPFWTNCGMDRFSFGSLHP